MAVGPMMDGGGTKPQPKPVVKPVVKPATATSPAVVAAMQADKAKPVPKPTAPSNQFNWAQSYEKALSSGKMPSLMNPEGSMYAGDLIQSSKNIQAGVAGPLDYVNVALAPFALAGYGATKGVKAADRLAALALAKSTLKNPRVSITAPREVIGDIYSSRFKNQFETDPQNAASNLRRAEVERGMGIPVDAPGYQRPVYGAIENKLNLPLWALNALPGRTGAVARITDPRTNSAKWFGGANPAIAHLDARNIPGTFTVGDSFEPVLGPLNLGDKAARDFAANRLVSAVEQKTPVPYIEAQLRPQVEPFSNTSNLLESVKRLDLPISGNELFWLSRAAADVTPGTYENIGALSKAAQSKAVKDLIKKRTADYQRRLEEAAAMGGNLPPASVRAGNLPTTTAEFIETAKAFDPFFTADFDEIAYRNYLRGLR